MTLIPWYYKALGVVGLLATMWAGLLIHDHKVDKKGYERCQSEHIELTKKAEIKARIKIKEVNKSYEAVQKKLLSDTSPVVPAGPRVSGAIGGMRGPSERSK